MDIWYRFNELVVFSDESMSLAAVGTGAFNSVAALSLVTICSILNIPDIVPAGPILSPISSPSDLIYKCGTATFSADSLRRMGNSAGAYRWKIGNSANLLEYRQDRWWAGPPEKLSKCLLDAKVGGYLRYRWSVDTSTKLRPNEKFVVVFIDESRYGCLEKVDFEKRARFFVSESKSAIRIGVSFAAPPVGASLPTAMHLINASKFP